MRFRGWHIDGFGSLADWRVDELSGGLNVFYGPNEAGKSTLLGFLRFALFGFRPGNTRDPKYPPPPGIRHGGRVYTSHDDQAEVFTIERIANVSRGARKLRVLLPDGSEGEEAELSRLIGHADRDLYTSVFAFSLSELQSIDTLTAKGVQDHIFSAGITGAGRSAREALGQIQKESDELFKGRARCRLNTLVEELSELDQNLRTQREQARGYPELIRREGELADRHADVRDQVENSRRAGLRGRKLAEVWAEIYRPLIQARETLSGLPAAASFDPEPRERLDEAVAEQSLCKNALTGLQADVTRVSGELERLKEDSSAFAVRDAVEALERELGLYESQCKEIPSRRQMHALLASGLRDALTSLGPDWDAERLAGFHFSVASAGEATRFGERLRQSDQSVRDLQHSLRTEGERLEGLREQRDRELGEHDEDRDSEAQAPKAPALEQRAAQLRALRAGLGEWVNLEVRIEGKRYLTGAADRTRHRIRLGCAVAFAAAGVVMAAFFVGNGWRVSSDPGFVVAFVSWLASSLAWVFTRKPSRTSLAHKAELEGLEEQLEETRASMSGLADGLGMNAEVESGDLDRVESELARDRAAAALLQGRKTQSERTQAEIARMKKTIEGFESGLGGASEAYTELQAQWEAWRREAGLPEALAPGDVSVFASGVGRAKDQLAAVAQAAAGVAELEAAIENWESRARRALEEVGGSVPESASDTVGDALLVQQIVQLARRTRDAQTREEQRPAVLAARLALDEKLTELELDVVGADGRLSKLFERVGASDRDDYLAKLSHFQQRCDLEETIREREAELERRLGLGEEAESFVAELALGRVGEWEREVASAELAVHQQQESSDQVLREHQDARKAKEELEGSNGVGALALNRAALHQELVEVVARWRVLQVARRLIETTLEQFEKERQPAVLQEASHYFSSVTAGRYPQIVQTAELGGFSVIDAAGGRKTPAQLSRGTAEQLYVCIRLGLIAEFSRRVGRLPVAMDDVLVNFDDDRALAMAHVLDEFSQRNDCQVLVFTCSSRTRELFAKAAPLAAHFEIEAPAS